VKSSERNTPIPVGRFSRIPDSNESGKDTSSDYCALWRSPPAESSSHWRTQKKIEYRARKNRPGCPLPEIAQDGVHHASHGLGRHKGQLPDPLPRTGEGISLDPRSPELRQAPRSPRPRRSRRVRAGGRPVRSMPIDHRERACAKSVSHQQERPWPRQRTGRCQSLGNREIGLLARTSRTSKVPSLEKPNRSRPGRLSHIRHKGRCCGDGRRRRCLWNDRR